MTHHQEKNTPPQPLQLKRLVIENIRCFENIDLSFLDGKKIRHQTILVGENGHGKSTILRAIAIGLCPSKEANALISMMPGEMVRINKQGRAIEKGAIHLELFDPQNPEQEYKITTHISRDAHQQESLSKQTLPEDFPWVRIFACGYGVNRGNERFSPISSYQTMSALQSLFNKESSLWDPEAVLRMFKLAENEGQEGKRRYEETINNLKAVLGLKTSHKIDILASKILVHGPWGAMPFRALGDGYQGTSTWILDFLGRAYQQSLATQGKSMGILLVDEVDEHLHPSWQRKIIGSLAKRFPKVQLIATTHSPTTIVNCEPQQVFVCHLHNTISSLSQEMPSLEGKTTDEILRGEWFGLKETMADRTEKILADYRKAVQERQPEETIRALRSMLREQVGSLSATPLDEFALKVTAEYRQQFLKGDAQTQRQLIQQAVQQLRKELELS